MNMKELLNELNPTDAQTLETVVDQYVEMIEEDGRLGDLDNLFHLVEKVAKDPVLAMHDKAKVFVNDCLMDQMDKCLIVEV